LKLDWLHSQKNEVFYLTPPAKEFEEVYLNVRNKEQRVLQDEIVMLLPFVNEDHPYASEWKKRRDTLQRFTKYLSNRKPNRVLEIGCGNGWFAHKISDHTNICVGLDVGEEELQQAARCFSNDKLAFVCCEDWNQIPEGSFDLVVFNASIQYFDLTDQFWKDVYRLLDHGGEVHILDSMFYQKDMGVTAKSRSEEYFKELGVKEACSYYRHQTWEELPTNYKLKYKPTRLRSKFNRGKSPFPWIKIKAVYGEG